MTAQIKDVFCFDGNEYSIPAISNEPLLDPSLLGINPRWASTACYRGYQAVFALAAGRLVLQNLHTNLPAEKDSSFVGVGPPINGVHPTGKSREFDLFDAHYNDVNVYLKYCGGLLLGGDVINQAYEVYGGNPAWNYNVVLELVFENGRLLVQHNRSEAMSDYRKLIAQKGSHKYFRKKMRKFITTAFDCLYQL